MKSRVDWLVRGCMVFCCVISTIVVVLWLSGFRFVAIRSGSMKPELGIGELCIVRECDRYRLDDIITYDLGDICVTHRVVSVSSDKQSYTTRGDSNNSVDSVKIPIENIVGKVYFHIPKLGYVMFFLSSIYGKVLVGLVVVLLVVFSYASDSDKSKDKEGHA